MILSCSVSNLIMFSGKNNNKFSSLLSSPRDFDIIQDGEFKNSFIVLDGVNQLKIISQNNKILAENVLQIPYVSDIEIGPNNTIFIVDQLQDRIIQVPLSNISHVLWQWNAHNPADINWSEWLSHQYWDNNSVLSFSKSVNSSDFFLGISSIQFLNGSQQAQNASSLLVCCESFNFIFELTISETSEIIWSYGKYLNYDSLESPRVALLAPTSDLFIGEHKSPLVRRINYPSRFLMSYYSRNFPNGFVKEIQDIDWISENMILVATIGNPGLSLVNMSWPSSSKSIDFLDVATPQAIMHNSSKIFVLDEKSSSIYILDSYSFEVEKQIGESWRNSQLSFEFIFPIGYLVGLFLLIIWKSPPMKRDLLITNIIFFGVIIILFIQRQTLLYILYWNFS